jgi:hypothetical protein
LVIGKTLYPIETSVPEAAEISQCRRRFITAGDPEPITFNREAHHGFLFVND